MTKTRPLYVLIKAMILYVLANLVFAYFDPAVGRLSIYNWLVPGRERVPYEREVEYYNISHTVPVYEDMDAMYQSTTLSLPKRPDEFRVFLVGDSSAWGFELRPEDTLVGQINALQLVACDGRNIVAYNAAFPLPYVMKDLLLIDKVLEYDPDLFLWTISLDAFSNRQTFTRHFLDPHSRRVRELVENYNIRNLDTGQMTTQTFWEKTLVGQRSRLKKLLLLQFHGFGWSASRLDYDYRKYEPLSQDLSADARSSFDDMKLNEMLFDVLDAGRERICDLPVLVVNEPIFIASGRNSDARYNDFYPRWVYDEYLTYLNEWMESRQYHYVNAWDLLPSSEFTDSIFHRTPTGEKILAEFLAPQIQNLSCTK
jgi:hypothetical protein